MDDPQLKIARRMMAMLAGPLETEMDLLRRSLGRTPTRTEMAGRARSLFHTDPYFHAAVVAAKAQAEAQEMEAWRRLWAASATTP